MGSFDNEVVVPRYVKYTKAQLIEFGREKIAHYADTTYAEFLKDMEKYKSNCASTRHIEYLLNEFPKKLKYTDEEVYQDCIEDPENIGEDGSIFSTSNPNGFWDYYQIGGWYTGIHDNYDPIKDPENFETCFLCHGTGFRIDDAGRLARKEDPTYTCNGCGEYDIENHKWTLSKDRKPGISVKYPTNWVKHDGDV
jgi:hypothetical protein